MAVTGMAGRGSDGFQSLTIQGFQLDLVEGIVRALLFALVQSRQLPAFGSCCSWLSEVAVPPARAAEQDACICFTGFRSRCCCAVQASLLSCGRRAGQANRCATQFSSVWLLSSKSEALVKTAQAAFDCPG